MRNIRFAIVNLMEHPSLMIFPGTSFIRSLLPLCLIWKHRSENLSDRRSGLISAIAALIVAGCITSAKAETLRQPSLNYQMGVATHFCHKTPWMKTWVAETHIPMIAELGVGWIRDEITWADVEPVRGQYRISENTRKWIDLANAHGLRVIACFNNANQNYENNYDPQAYAKAAAWVAHELDGKIQAIEILNEPFNGYARYFSDNRKHNWYGRENDGSVSPWLARYVELLNTASDAIKAANPKIKVIGLGDTTPQNYLQIAMGISPSVDGITEHPYSFRTPPEIVPQPDQKAYRDKVGFAVADADGSFASWVRMYREYSQAHKGPKELWITESGYTTFREGDSKNEFLYSPFSEEAQAIYNQRRTMEAFATGVDINILYDFLDDSSLPGGVFNAEANFGMVRGDNSLKPAYKAIQSVARATKNLTRGNNVKIKVFPFSNRTEEHPRKWDDMVIPALSRILCYPFTNSHGQPVFAIWSAERLNDLNVRSADVEIDVNADQFVADVEDLFTGQVYSPTVKTVGGRMMLEKLMVPNHPILIKISQK